jgi:predicted Zn finger-like uncharacterized protein
MIRMEVTCDRCRAVIVVDRTKLAIASGPLRAVRVDDNGESIIDLCRECAEALLAWLRPERPVRN